MNVLLVDHLNTLIRSMHVHSRAFYDDQFTGGIYGYVSQIASAIAKHNIDLTIICKDAPPYKRKELFPAYKGNRTEASPEQKEQLRSSLKLVDEFLEIVGLPSVSIKGFEADDLIAQLHDDFYQTVDKIFIRSTDDDLFQLLDDKTILLRKGATTYTLRNFAKEYDFDVDYWAYYTALKGGHNNLKGVPGIGPKKAAKILENQTAIDLTCQQHREILDKELPLVQLPLEHLDIPTPVQGKSKRNEYLRFLNRLGIDPVRHLTDPFAPRNPWQNN